MDSVNYSVVSASRGVEGRYFGRRITLKGRREVPNAAVHDRMPAILDPDSYELCLDPGMTNVAAASDLLKPYDAPRNASKRE